MHMLNQVNPEIYEEVLRKQATVWAELVAALGASSKQAFSSSWSVALEISMDEVLADLTYGRE